MADEIYRMEDLYAEDIADNINEVRTARGEYDSLGERLDDIESGSFTPTPEQQAALDSGITADIVAADTAALIELVDESAKNKLSIGSPTLVPTGLTCVRNNDGTYIVSGTLSAANSISFNISAVEGDLVLSGCPEGGGNDTYLLRITKSGSQVAGSVDTGNGSDVFTMDGTGYALNIRFAAGTYSDVVFSPMICSDVAWTISQAYQPYRPSYQELYEMVLALQGGN